MKKKLLTLILTLCVCAIPLWAVVSGRSLTNTLKTSARNCKRPTSSVQMRSSASTKILSANTNG